MIRQVAKATQFSSYCVSVLVWSLQKAKELNETNKQTKAADENLEILQTVHSTYTVHPIIISAAGMFPNQQGKNN